MYNMNELISDFVSVNQECHSTSWGPWQALAAMASMLPTTTFDGLILFCYSPISVYVPQNVPSFTQNVRVPVSLIVLEFCLSACICHDAGQRPPQADGRGVEWVWANWNSLPSAIDEDPVSPIFLHYSMPAGDNFVCLSLPFYTYEPLLTLWRPLLPYGYAYSYKASCARLG